MICTAVILYNTSESIIESSAEVILGNGETLPPFEESDLLLEVATRSHELANSAPIIPRITRAVACSCSVGMGLVLSSIRSESST